MSSVRGWKPITGGLGSDRSIAYWSKQITPLLRIAVKGRTWTVYTRDDPRYAWTRGESGIAPSLAAAKRAGERAASCTS